jgi:hypothetical protein
VLKDAIRGQSSKDRGQQRNETHNKSRIEAPSARLTSAERDRIPKIRLELALDCIIAERWELIALVRGAKVSFNGKQYSYPALNDLPGVFFQHKVEWDNMVSIVT